MPRAFLPDPYFAPCDPVEQLEPANPVEPGLHAACMARQSLDRACKAVPKSGRRWRSRSPCRLSASAQGSGPRPPARSARSALSAVHRHAPCERTARPQENGHTPRPRGPGTHHSLAPARKACSCRPARMLAQSPSNPAHAREGLDGTHRLLFGELDPPPLGPGHPEHFGQTLLKIALNRQLPVPSAGLGASGGFS